MIIPIAVLNFNDDFPSGWVEAAVDMPAWWDLAATSASDDKPIRSSNRRAKKSRRVCCSIGRRTRYTAGSQWLRRQLLLAPLNGSPTLLSSPVFDEQKRLGGRAVRQMTSCCACSSRLMNVAERLRRQRLPERSSFRRCDSADYWRLPSAF